jgi:hypothetical protein
LLRYGLTTLSEITELEDRGDAVSVRGLGRVDTVEVFVGCLGIGEDGSESARFSFSPSFQAGGEGIWKSRSPLSSDKCALKCQ